MLGGGGRAQMACINWRRAISRNNPRNGRMVPPKSQRQLMQAICALPPPPNMIWRYPGFPSLLVTYHVANDFFFSGHTAIAVFGAMELSRLRRHWLTATALLIVVFEIAAVLVLRAHYTMDVFTGMVAAFWVRDVVNRVSPPIDRLFSSNHP